MRTIALLLATLPALAVAAANGEPSAGDPRIQIATYSPDEVYNIYIATGIASLIQFEADEDVENSPVGFGDSEAWKVGITGNRMIIKPKADNPDTNVVIATNKRSYVLSLKTAKKKDTPTWLLRFRYPDTEAAEQAARRERERQTEEKRRLAEVPVVKTNTNYTMAGDFKIAPAAAWDDGRFTTFQYPDNRELPAVFKRSADGTEALVNAHTEGDRLVIHETNDVFILRLGNLVLGIYNEGYDAVGNFNSRGTSINAIRTETKHVH
ncbi:MAG: P-type conjugative transfer protein VirB9 [Betaproteobacteria bacterium]|nr:P-type conjugative transfer protein VirB9 [Betaproteobacteria bacterium]